MSKLPLTAKDQFAIQIVYGMPFCTVKSLTTNEPAVLLSLADQLRDAAATLDHKLEAARRAHEEFVGQQDAEDADGSNLEH